MYDAVKEVLLDLFRAPHHPPETPAGSPGSAKVFRASRQFLKYQILFLTVGMSVLALVLFCVIVLVMTQKPVVGLLISMLVAILWLLFFVAFIFIIHLEYDMRYYIVTDRSLRVRKGVLHIVEQTLTFVNIQNIKVEQGPIQRFFGISSLVVETAGGGMTMDSQKGAQISYHHSAVMNGLDNAEEYRDLILNYLKKLPVNSGLGAQDDSVSAGQAVGFSDAEVLALRDVLTELTMLRSELTLKKDGS